MANERILIFDDRSRATKALEAGHYEPVVALDRADAIARIKATLVEKGRIFDLVVAGSTADGLPDFSFMEQVRELCPETSLIAILSSDKADAVLDAIHRGADDCLLDPFQPEELVVAAARILKRRSGAWRNILDRKYLEQLVTTRTEMLRDAVTALEHAYDVTLEALGDALDLKDAETEGHSRRVTAYTMALARAMGIDNDRVRVMARGAFLHDIGKMAIPDAILLKPGKLDRREQAVMREHCARGYQILRKIPFLEEAAEIVYSHQEHFDGTGYPRRLKGEAIILGARVFSVADTLDAITSDRPYRRANSFEAARAEILRCSGAQFDPVVVRTFDDLPLHLWEDLRTEIQHKDRMTKLTGGG